MRRLGDMARLAAWSLVAGVVLPATGLSQSSAPPAEPGGVVDTLHGVAVPDPFRWMEAMDAPRTVEWARSEDARARRYAAAFPGREALRARIARIAATRRFMAPTPAGGRLFYVEFPASGGPPGSSPGAVLRVRSAGSGADDRALVDPAAEGMGPDASLARGVPDHQGRRVAWGVTRAGSTWETVRIRDVETGRDLEESLTGIRTARSAISWAPDGSGFWYERFPVPAPGEEQRARLADERLAFHRLGTDPAADPTVYRDAEHPERELWHAVSDDGRYLVVGTRDPETQHSDLRVLDLRDPGSGFRTLVAEPDAAYAFAGNDGPVLWLYTDRDAPRGRVVAVDLREPGSGGWSDLVPEDEATISSWILARGIGDRLLVGYLEDARTVVRVFDATGRPLGPLDLPAGSIWSGFVGRQGDPVAYYVLSGLVDPGSIHRLDVETGASEPVRRPDLGYDPSAFTTEQVFYESRDGTRVPMFVVRGPDSARPGPVWIYGYGFGAWPAAPWFQPAMVAWLEMGGVWALPNIRGGGEYGEAWHRAGSRSEKQNAIDDYVAAAEWLIESGIAAPDGVVANASSAGGAMAGAAIVQRPDLFGAAILDYPVLDMLRYDRFTVAGSWRSEYGTAEDADDFRALLAYSPVHSVEPGRCYPATLVAPGEKDQIAPPFHAYKFVAALRRARGCDRPVLLRVSWGAGHAAGADLEASIETWADELAFLARTLDLDTEAPRTVGR